ncbi:MBL fold metallo-hydrolase [Brevundimonas basaltis]|uniref:L-ascorbate metabolism protein UlaG (Beta-lactamase superfamily) n=1 Tax=Brevundimonas basaltis TaxID=472166 RepID=A0A7W8HZQ8_9CAUL|nr:MBL fold metallo-hydrolase [Brevundimonas basaltis]MBB5292073.1 L-ascorbate metabolism protein UlaG (beta-lactamase superfamily) [Brevundimonas basaltis]
MTLVLAAHSHHDHAMDSATIAASQEAELAGSESVRWLAEGADFPKERFRLVKHRTVLEVGRPVRFHITAFETPHSPHPFFRGDLEAPLRPPIWGPNYRGGPNFSFLIEHSLAKMLVVPSANFVCEALLERHADVVFLSLGGIGRQSLEFFETYWRETVLRPQASTVVLTHWDDFFISLDKPLRPMRRLIDDVETALDWVEAAAGRDGVELIIPAPFRPAAVDALISGVSRPVPFNHGTCVGDTRA